MGCNTFVLAPPLTRTLSPPPLRRSPAGGRARARHGPRPLSLHPQPPLHVTPASQVSATSDKPLALGHRDRSSDSTTTPFCIAVVTDNRALKADRTATMNPVLICLLVMVTFFFLLYDAARTGLAQGRAISPSP